MDITKKVASAYDAPDICLDDLKAMSTKEINEVFSEQMNLLSQVINYRLEEVGVEADIQLNWLNILHSEENPLGHVGYIRARIIAGDAPFKSMISDERKAFLLKSISPSIDTTLVE